MQDSIDKWNSIVQFIRRRVLFVTLLFDYKSVSDLCCMESMQINNRVDAQLWVYESSYGAVYYTVAYWLVLYRDHWNLSSN